MRQLRFCYKMQLTFTREVRNHRFLIRCKPAENNRQHCGNYSFRITPAVPVDEVEDGFGNRGFCAVLRDPHDRVCVTSEGIVRVQNEGISEPAPAMYRFPTPRTVPEQNIREFLDSAQAAYGKPVTGLSGCHFLMDRLYGLFSYVPGVTGTQTTAAQALALGKGVCQDYAHILISLLRLCGIPARYVAGMMTGEGASHAWAEAWVDGIWHGLDPTNNLFVDDFYIKLTHGRDFGDSTIDKGSFEGFAGQSHTIRVKVDEVL